MKKLNLKKNKTKEEVKESRGNLRDIMDFTVPFKMIYSGVESDSYFDIVYDCGARNFLMSYHYLQAKHVNFKERFKGKEVRLFIDSGAHTYQNDPKYQEVTVEEWEEHLKKYLRWVERNRDYIFAIASFDFENVVGSQVVDRWNKEYFEPFMLRTGIPVCFVWHQNSYNTWEYYCQRYPYVGFSSVNTEGAAIDLQEYKSKLKVAEKFDSLVHGFGMTRTSMLTELPFYTTDSTTWMVGLQYGEMNYWDNGKMRRLKKVDWKGRYLETIASRYNLDREKLEKEDTMEMIKANVMAFIDAENFIHTRLKSMMYWMKAKVTKVDIDNAEPGFFPTQEWMNGSDKSNASEYAKRMNINPEYQLVADLVCDATMFIKWGDPDYSEIQSWYQENGELISSLHDTYINRIVGSFEEKVEDLRKFFRECVSGENDKLLHLGTNFDRVIREREEYIEDDIEVDMVDLSPEEMKVKLLGVLPTPEDLEEQPELEELDEEIFRKAEIIPTFNEKGKFVKGQVAVRRPKRLYSKKFPKLACDTCYAAQKCPEYKSGYVCAFNKLFDRFDTRNSADIIQAMQGMVDFNLARMQRAMVLENLTGNFDPNVTNMINQNMSLLRSLNDLYTHGSPEVLRQTRVVRADGSEEQTTQITNPQSGGILEKLFSGATKNVEEVPEEEPVKKNERYLVTDEEE